MEAQDGTERGSRAGRPGTVGHCRGGREPWAVTEGSKYENHKAASDLRCQEIPLGPVRRRDVGWRGWEERQQGDRLKG